MTKLKTEKFDTTLEALDFIDSLKEKNKKCEGVLNCKPTKDETKFVWIVTYNPALLKIKIKVGKAG
jgi:hypothetical protein